MKVTTEILGEYLDEVHQAFEENREYPDAIFLGASVEQIVNSALGLLPVDECNYLRNCGDSRLFRQFSAGAIRNYIRGYQVKNSISGLLLYGVVLIDKVITYPAIARGLLPLPQDFLVLKQYKQPIVDAYLSFCADHASFFDVWRIRGALTAIAPDTEIQAIAKQSTWADISTGNGEYALNMGTRRKTTGFFVASPVGTIPNYSN